MKNWQIKGDGSGTGTQTTGFALCAVKLKSVDFFNVMLLTRIIVLRVN